MVFEGGCNADVTGIYFRDILLPRLARGSVVALDNASFHKASSARELAQACGVELLYLPAYSLDLNPIEHFWARLKAYLRKLTPYSNDKMQTICDACRFFGQAGKEIYLDVV